MIGVWWKCYESFLSFDGIIVMFIEVVYAEIFPTYELFWIGVGRAVGLILGWRTLASNKSEVEP